MGAKETSLPFPITIGTEWVYNVFAVGVRGTLTQTLSGVKQGEGGWEVRVTTWARMGSDAEKRLIGTDLYLVSRESLFRLTGFGGVLAPPLPLWWRGEGTPEVIWEGRLVRNGEEQGIAGRVSRLGKERIRLQGKALEAEKIRVVLTGAPFAHEQIYWLVPGTGFVKFQLETPGGRVSALLQDFSSPREGV